MHPNEIRLFSFFHLGAIALVLANNLIFWDFNVANLSTETGLGAAIPHSLAAIALLVPLLLWYLVVFRRSRTTRWIIGAMAVFWGLGVVGAVGVMPPAMVTITAAALVFQVIGLYCLFRPAAADWFAT